MAVLGVRNAYIRRREPKRYKTAEQTDRKVSFQSQLTDDIAEELAAEQRSISVAEFFEKNKHMLGFDSPARGLVTAVKEGVDNSLDACEEAGILPDILVEIEEVRDGYRLVIEDNGPGIVKRQIPKIFGKLLYGSRFGKRVQSRGQQGIGISAAVLYAQMTSGKPALVTSKTQSGEAQRFEVIIDTDTNEPEIVSEEEVQWDRTHGTRIEIEMEANMRARSQLHDYFKNTAVVNPHARLRLHEPNGEFSFERATDELPEEPSEIKPHPHGIELGTLIRLLEATDSYSVRGFVSNEFTRVGGKTADKILDGFRDRHHGREAAWSPPRRYEREEGLAGIVSDSVANKPADATDTFAGCIVGRVEEREQLTRSDVQEIVSEAAEENDKRFGDTVRQNATNAVWKVVVESREDDLYTILDSATTERKDEAAVRDLAERLAARFEEADDTMTRDELDGAVNAAADGVEEVREARFGEKAREKVADAVWDGMVTIDDDVPSTDEVAADRDIARHLINAMRAVDVIAPPTDCLSPIGAEDLEAGLRKEYDADFYAATTRDAGVHGGDPFVAEAGIAYGGSIPAEGNATLLRFANRVPLVYQQGACAITNTVSDIGWKNYGLDESSLPQGPAVVAVHVASTNVPFTSESKDAVANVPEIEDEIERAVREVGRELKSHIKETRSRRKRREKERVVANLLPQMAEKVAEVTERETPSTDATLARILNKVTVEAKADGGTTTVTVENNSDRKQQFEVHAFVDEEVEMDGDANVVDLGDEFDVVWNVSVSKNEEDTLEVPAEASVTVDGVEDELVEVVE
jgi:DNA topoisomerase-6 subunit B